ncbi:MAG: CPBP family intramembrane glutamic endopeptidase [bacterium]
MSKTRFEPSHVEKSLNVWAIILIVWSLYRAYIGTSLPVWFDEFIAKPIVFIIPIYFFIKKVEKAKFFKSLGFSSKNIIKEMLIGLIVGLVFLSILYYGYISRGGQSLDYKKFSDVPYLLGIIFLSFATSISEEILSRGFILKRLFEASKNMFTSSLFASILFFFMHIPILFTSQSLSGILLVRLMTIDILLSFIISILFLLRKNITVPIFIHAFYVFILWFLI